MKRTLGCVLSICMISGSLGGGSTRAGEVTGQVILLKEGMTESPPVNWGGLVVLSIPDFGAAPPENVIATQQNFTKLGNVRGVETNDAGQPAMNGGYSWRLFSPKQGFRSGTIEAFYLRMGGPKPIPVYRSYHIDFTSQPRGYKNDKRKWQLCAGEYYAFQAPGRVFLSALGAHPTLGYQVELQQLPLDIYPPEYRLAHKAPIDPTGQVVTPFHVTASFIAPTKVDTITIHNRDGEYTVAVEQVPDRSH